MNLTRTRVARILMVGATLGMTIGLASSGLTAAAAEASPTGSRIENAARYRVVPTAPSDFARPDIGYYPDTDITSAIGRR